MPLKSAIAFLTFACVIISWPFRMPPSKSPMITSTMAISTRVKPFARFMAPPEAALRSKRAAEHVDVGAGFLVRNVGARNGAHDVRVGARLRLPAHRTGVDLAVVHL